MLTIHKPDGRLCNGLARRDFLRVGGLGATGLTLADLLRLRARGAMAGGGLNMGQVIGATDARGEQITRRRVAPQNVMATLYHVLGIDPAQTVPEFNGRPISLLDDRETIGELI